MSTRSRSPSSAASPPRAAQLSVRARPASLWPLVYLLDSLSLQYRAAVASCLPNLPIIVPPRNATSGTMPGAGGRPGSWAHGAPPGGLVLVSKDLDNIREIALREYIELVIDETEVSEATPEEGVTPLARSF
jgi:gamma-tubulin complex component 3